MKYAGYKESCIENGVGCRTSVFVSGCSHHCKGCFNSETWDFNYGHEMTDEIIEKILKTMEPKYVKGLTILGGEPMEVQNQKGVWELITKMKEKYPDKTIWMYSGYTWEQLNDPENKRTNTEYTSLILENIDILVDGPFILEKKDLSLLFRGSSNQRVIDVRKTLENDEIVLSVHGK